jgi:hypothetical protein
MVSVSHMFGASRGCTAWRERWSSTTDILDLCLRISFLVCVSAGSRYNSHYKREPHSFFHLELAQADPSVASLHARASGVCYIDNNVNMLLLLQVVSLSSIVTTP